MNEQEVKKLHEKIKDEVAVFHLNANLMANDGNKSAGRRSRQSTLKLQKLFLEWRKVTVEKKVYPEA